MSRFDKSQLHDQILKEIERAGPFATVDDINRRLEVLRESYNHRPQADLGGLSPHQMSVLLNDDWEGGGSLRLNSALPYLQVVASTYLGDARKVISYVMERGPIKLTPAGNLPRRDVARLGPILEMVIFDDDVRPSALNEADVFWLYVLRNNLEIAKLLVRRHGLIASKNAERLVEEEHAGELNALLFRTFFQRFNLSFMDNSDRFPELQSTVAFSFFRLRSEATDWRTPEALAESCWHPDMKDPTEPADVEHDDYRHWTFTHRVLKPLDKFGLMERREIDPSARWKEYEYRITPLYNRFMTFHFER